MHEFDPTNSGAKSNNLKILQNKISENIKLPESVTIPYQMAEYSINLEPKVNDHLKMLI